MKKFIMIMSLILIQTSFISAAEIKDIPNSSAAYITVKKAVNNGYLGLFDDKTFRGDVPVTRKELAIAIEKLLVEVDTRGLNLSKAEIQELIHLAAIFKQYLKDNDTQKNKVTNTITLIKEDQKNLNYNMAKMDETIKSHDQNQLYTWIGIGLAVLLGIVK